MLLLLSIAFKIDYNFALDTHSPHQVEFWNITTV